MRTPYRDQLASKSARVRRALGRYARLQNLVVADTVAAATTLAYRTRAKLVTGRGGALGLFGGGHAVADGPGCLILRPALAEVAEAVRGAMRRPGTPRAVVAQADGGALLGVDARELIGEDGPRVLVTLTLDRDANVTDAEITAAAALLSSVCPMVVGVAVAARSARSPRVLGSAPRVVLGPASLVDRIGEVEIRAAHGSFVQAHRGQAERFAAAIVRGLSDALGGLAGRRVIELYAGAGALGLALAGAGAEVTLVEAYEPAVRESRRGITPRARFVSGAAERVLPELLSEGRCDAIVVDPPRRGLDPLVRNAIARASVPHLAYLSCHPETLARDLEHFTVHGLSTDLVTPFDAIPQSAEVECLAVLARREPRGAPPIARGAAHAVSPWDHARDLVAGASGVSLTDAAPREACFWVCVRGRSHGKGTLRRSGATLRYRRIGGGASFSLLEVRTDAVSGEAIERQLASIGHPVLGSAAHGHGPTNRYFAERWCLDRPWLHRASVTLADDREIAAPLAGDLAGFLESTGVAAPSRER